MMDSASFSYLLSNPGALGLSLVRPTMLLLALILPLFFVRSAGGGTTASKFRAAAVVSLLAVLAGARISARVPADRLTLVAAVDLSDSVGERARPWSQQLLAEVARRLAPGDQIAVVTFAGGSQPLRSMGAAALPPELPWPPMRTATDLGAVIDTAVALYPSEGERRLLLITDGNETRGDGAARLPLLQAEAIRVDAVVPPRNERAAVQLDKLVVPSIISEAGIVPLRVVAQNPGPTRSAVLNLHVDGRIMDSMTVELQSGTNSFTLRSQIVEPGNHLLRAELVPPGDVESNERVREANVTVRGQMRLLLAAPDGNSLLRQVLQSKGFDVETRPPDRLPRHAEDLARYHAVLLEDVTSEQLAAQSLESLERYVADDGGGLVFVAGANTYGDPRLAESPLKRVLPLTLEPRRPRAGSREPLALFVLIDRSNSMGYNSRAGTLRDGEKLRYAKNAALTVVRQLKDHDLVGVIAFDSRPHEIATLEPLARNRDRLERLLPQLVEGGGTDFFDALESARRQLARSRVNRRHIILLTDGDTNRSDPREYKSLLGQLAEEQVSVTTIRIGDNTINLNLLEQISRRTGGEFHHVPDARRLPNLMQKDATRAVGPTSSGPEQFFPQIGTPSQVVRGIDEQGLPALEGYAYAKAKAGAQISLQITRLDRSDPLLAGWQYGLGRVIAFAASPREDAFRWIDWPDYSKLWSQVVHWAARAHNSDEHVVEATRQGEEVHLSVRTFGPPGDDSAVLARIHLGQEHARDVRLAPAARQVFSTLVPSLPAGVYPITIVRRSADRVVERTETVAIPATDHEPREENRQQEPNLRLLTLLSTATGGKLNATAQEITSRPLGRERVHYSMDHVLVPLAMLLFLADVGIRRRRRKPSAA